MANKSIIINDKIDSKKFVKGVVSTPLKNVTSHTADKKLNNQGEYAVSNFKMRDLYEHKRALKPSSSHANS